MENRVRDEGRLTAGQVGALDFRMLCAGARAAQAATPTGRVQSRLDVEEVRSDELAGLIRRVREDAGAPPAATGRFNNLSALRKPL